MIFQRVNSYKYYQDFVDALRSTFFKLNLILDGEPAIYLSDPVWRDCALSIWDKDHDGYITKVEADVSYMLNVAALQNTDLIQVLDLSKLATKGLYNFYASNLPNLREIYFGKIDTGVPVLPYQGFMNNISLELLDMGDYAQETNRMLCKGATNLKKVVVSKSLTKVDAQAFMNCTSLAEISDIPDSCTGIYGDYNNEVFRNCTSMKSITVGRGMQRIGWGTFRDCTAMESFYIKATTPPTLDGDVFTNNPCTIYVPIGCGTAYKTATNWSTYASRIQEYNF